METSSFCLRYLAARVTKLEKRNRLYKCGGLILLASLAIIAVMGHAQPIAAVQSQTQLPQKDEPTLTFRGGSGSSLLRQCEMAVKLGIGSGGARSFKVSEMQDVVDGSFCSGYVAGVVDTLTFVRPPETRLVADRICVPANVDGSQLVHVVAKSLNDNPTTLNSPADFLVVGSMEVAFPCK
jgi:hypothetical protein